ncbi:MAG: hypothetical protein WCE42_17300 [Rhizobium ruizarguesonis]|uniref:hypothetical protein n=1 Tax=Rhizobium ruizarguesonis TaxID=2081791 RepID=UPI0010323F43|nr:hypothetical protein [Rhizobium ruizarguesonis]TAU66749.1 hypothetical protein ELI45_02095 [Rhizobium ruizarguesonis]
MSELSATVADAFISRLDPASGSYAAVLEVSSGKVQLYRRRRTSAGNGKHLVSLEFYGVNPTEAMLCRALHHAATRDDLRRIVDAMLGVPGFDAKGAGGMIAFAAFNEQDSSR